MEQSVLLHQKRASHRLIRFFDITVTGVKELIEWGFFLYDLVKRISEVARPRIKHWWLKRKTQTIRPVSIPPAQDFILPLMAGRSFETIYRNWDREREYYYGMGRGSQTILLPGIPSSEGFNQPPMKAP